MISYLHFILSPFVKSSCSGSLQPASLQVRLFREDFESTRVEPVMRIAAKDDFAII